MDKPISKPSYEALLESAAEALAEKNYYKALKSYEEAYDEEKDKALVKPIAQLHLMLRDYRRAERSYSRFVG